MLSLFKTIGPTATRATPGAESTLCSTRPLSKTIRRPGWIWTVYSAPTLGVILKVPAPAKYKMPVLFCTASPVAKITSA